MLLLSISCRILLLPRLLLILVTSHPKRAREMKSRRAEPRLMGGSQGAERQLSPFYHNFALSSFKSIPTRINYKLD